MRNPERIPEILQLLNQLWEKDQDLRFFQMIYNLQSEYSYKNEDLGKVEETVDQGFSRVGYDFFNVEDDQLINLLKAKLAHE